MLKLDVCKQCSKNIRENNMAKEVKLALDAHQESRTSTLYISCAKKAGWHIVASSVFSMVGSPAELKRRNND